MLNLIISLIGIILTILLVVSFHEFGHFIVARLVGVKVLRFSIGFGKPFYRWSDRRGTEYVLAPIPLGGYVKMLDEREGEVPKEELYLAYNRQPIYKQFLIVCAGPLFNFIVAFVLYWLLFVIGFNGIIPIIGHITPHSIADVAGAKPQQEILSINHTQTPNWMSATITLLTMAGEKGKIQVEVKDQDKQQIKSLVFDLASWHLDDLKPQPLESLGIIPYEPEVPAIIGKIQPGSPAESKLMLNDRVLSINRQPIKNWYDLAFFIEKHPSETVTFLIERNKKMLAIQLTIGYQRDLFFQKHGFLGVGANFEWPKGLVRLQKHGPIDSLNAAFKETSNLIQLNFILLGKMLTGKISVKSLGGPLTIFESAGTALNHGVIPFMGFLAFLNIAIGIVNILPIPGLDGGHVLMQGIELIARRPVSLRWQLILFRLGLILLFLLLIQGLANDLMRL
jgi:regulator of sigma E protease